MQLTMNNVIVWMQLIVWLQEVEVVQDLLFVRAPDIQPANDRVLVCRCPLQLDPM